MFRKKRYGVILIWMFLALVLNGQAQSEYTLMYKKPAKHFEETIVLGNGKMGAAIHGGVSNEKIFLNDATLWYGHPIDHNKINRDASSFLPLVREALKKGDYPLADSLNKKMQGKATSAYAPLGTVLLNMFHPADTINYERSLNLKDAISNVSYTIDGVTYKRESFISAPDKIMVIHLSASKKKSVSFSIGFTSQLVHENRIVDNMVQSKGIAIPAKDFKPRDIQSDTSHSIRFTSLIKVIHSDGTFNVTDTSLELLQATEATVLVSVQTSFNGFDKSPSKDGVDDLAEARKNISNVEKLSFATLKSKHLKDYQQFFNRVELNINGNPKSVLPTDERLKAYQQGAIDHSLEVLYFNFGRYLLISSSRTPHVPANLQGIWSASLHPPWNSDYTVNINTEMNYWPAEVCNLSEFHKPLLDFLEDLSVTGAVTAKNFYNAKGWCAAHNSDIWALSCPAGNFGKGDPRWANWNMGGAWLSTHLWEHYAFTQDKTYLKNYAYKILKGAAEFCTSMLIEDSVGNLITSPATSPENIFITPQGYKGSTAFGTTCDIAIVRELFSNTIQAAEVLGVDAQFVSTLKNQKSKLYPYQIGKNGNLQEWYYDWSDKDPRHRHQSQLFGLFPGHQITVEKTPALAAACKKTLEIKGDATTGWSKAWRMNLWAHLKDGNHTYKMYRELLKYVEPDGKNDFAGQGGTYPNLFDAHPPFQIDGNFGGTAAVSEILIQSQSDLIELLPALPDAWKNGSVKGLCARGGFVVDMSWSNNHLNAATVFSKNGGKTVVVYGEQKKEVSLLKNQKVQLFFK